MRIRIRTHSKALKDTELYDSLGYICNFVNIDVIYGLKSGIQRLIRVCIFTVKRKEVTTMGWVALIIFIIALIVVVIQYWQVTLMFVVTLCANVSETLTP